MYYNGAGRRKAPTDIIHEPEIAKYVEDWGREGDNGLIAAAKDGLNVGAIWFRLFEETNKTYGFIDEETPIISMAVAETFRSKGIGRMLMSNLLKEAKLTGFDKLSLSVDPRNPALKLYKEFGFQKAGVDGTSWNMVIKL